MLEANFAPLVEREAAERETAKVLEESAQKIEEAAADELFDQVENSVAFNNKILDLIEKLQSKAKTLQGSWPPFGTIVAFTKYW